MSFGGSPPQAQPPPPIPDEASIEVQLAMEEARQRNRRKRGYSSTILTKSLGGMDALGATGTLSESASG